MSDKRYLGNIITPNPTEPAGSYENDAASGVWSLAEALAYTKAGLWPTAGNVLPIALFTGRESNSGKVNVVDRITITTTGNATDFGDMINSIGKGSMSASSATRAISAGGNRISNNTASNQIQYFTFATSGNGTNFGTLTKTADRGGATASSTRGVFAGGYTGSTATNIIDYVTMATTGNATDFGDLITTDTISMYDGIISNGTRGVFAGGAVTNVIQYITIATTGNAADFGDITFGSDREGGACCSSTRGLLAGDSDRSNVIQYITIATGGNSSDFGDLTSGRLALAGTSSETRGVFGGGKTLTPNENTNIIDYVTIASLGNATDFGDLTVNGEDISGASNVHGGLS